MWRASAVGGLLGHKVYLVGVKIFRNASSSFCAVVVVFQRLVLLSVPQARDNLINAIRLEEERGRRSNLSDESRKGGTPVRQRTQRPRSKVVCYFR